jgi:predicted HicB family RNase H-like nuclease
VLRLDPATHEAATIAAAAHGKSLNQWVVETLQEAAKTRV